MKPAHLVLALLSAVVLTACSTPTQIMLDRKARELCAIDGGVLVYKHAELPPESFYPDGEVKAFRAIAGELALGSRFIYNERRTYVVEGDTAYGSTASLFRTRVEVQLRSSGELLGSSTTYTRYGGDFINFNIPSGTTCPAGLGHQALLKAVFRKAE